MKKIRLISIMLMVILVCTACASGSGSSGNTGKKYGYFTFDGLDWDMTKAEVLDAIDKTENDVQINGKVSEIREFNGKSAEVEYTFEEIGREEYLTYICIRVEDLTREEIDDMVSFAGKCIDKQEIPCEKEVHEQLMSDDVQFSYDSNAKFWDIPDDLLDEAEKAYAKMSGDNEMLSERFNGESPLNEASIYAGYQGSYVEVNVWGDRIGEVLAYVREGKGAKSN